MCPPPVCPPQRSDWVTSLLLRGREGLGEAGAAFHWCSLTAHQAHTWLLAPPLGGVRSWVMVSVLWGGPGGWWWEGRRGHQPSLAQVQVLLWRMKTQQPPPMSSAQTGPGGRPGQGGSQRSLPCSLPKHWDLMPSCQQLLSLPSPEAREAAPGFWMGQMAGDRLGGTAEWWKVGRGHLAMPLATQLFSPHGGRVQPRQQAEAHVTEARRTGAAPTPREASPRGGTWQYQGTWKADTTPVKRPE